MKKLNYVSLAKKTAVYLFGLVSFSFGLSICAITELGLGPWDVLAQGIARQLDIGLGGGSIIVSFVVLVIALLLKVIPGIGTFFNIIIIGLLIDVILPVLNTYLSVSDSYFVLVPLYIFGLIFMSLGASLYIVARFGAGPRDSLLLGLIQKFKVDVTFVKPGIEGIILILGIFLGGTFGIGTIINLFLMGYFMDIVFKRIKFDPKVVRQYNIIEQYIFIKNAFSNKKC